MDGKLTKKSWNPIDEGRKYLKESRGYSETRIYSVMANLLWIYSCISFNQKSWCWNSHRLEERCQTSMYLQVLENIALKWTAYYCTDMHVPPSSACFFPPSPSNNTIILHVGNSSTDINYIIWQLLTCQVTEQLLTCQDLWLMDCIYPQGPKQCFVFYCRLIYDSLLDSLQFGTFPSNINSEMFLCPLNVLSTITTNLGSQIEERKRCSKN